MAVALDQDQQQITWSFPIVKMEATEDGDLRVFGKCTDGSVDRDMERIDVSWSQSALKSWLETGGNVRLQHDPKRPVGKGLKLDFSPDGHYLTALVVDPLAKEFVRKGVLTAYSVGITRPDFSPDPTGKAIRIITGRKDGQTEIAEVSLVDRPSNRNCGITLCKRAPDGTPEYVGKIFGADDFTAKATREEEPVVTVDLPKSASITFSPGDLAKLLEHRRVAEERQRAEKRNFDPDVGGGVDRDKIPAEDFAGRNRSFPIVVAGDVSDALQSIGRAGAANYDAATLRRNILRIARRKGFPVPESAREDSGKAAKPGRKCKLCRGSGKIRDGQMECPRCHGDGIRSPGETGEHGKTATAEGAPVSDDEAAKGAVAMPPATGTTAVAAKDDGGDEHEPVMHHDDGQDDDTDSDADANDKAAMPDMAAGKKPKVPCPKCKARCKPGARFCGKCGCSMTAQKAAKPTPGEGVTGTAAHDIEPVPAHREPDGPAFEALEHDAHLPTVPDASVKTAARMAELGVPGQEGMLHDLLCPAYPAASVKAAWPGADLSLTDEMGWQAKAFEVAASAPMGEFQQAAEKASQAWTAARILKSVPADLYDEIMTGARKAFRDANPGPGTAPQPGELSAQRFNRPYITAGHSAPSPDHDGPNKAPIHPGHISAADFSRGLITAGHAADSPENDTPRPEPVPAPEVPGVPSRVFYTNTQRQNAAQAMRAMHDHIAQTFPDLCPMHGPGRMGEPPSHARPVAAGVGGPVPHGASKADDPAAAKAAAKAAKKARKRAALTALISKDVWTREEAEAWFASNFGTPAVTKAVSGEAVTLEAANPGVSPDVIKAAVAEATAPVLERLEKQEKMLDAIASQPDAAVTAYRGAAIAKASAPPAGALSSPVNAEHAQAATYRVMYDQWQNHPDPELRNQAWTYLLGATGLMPKPPA